MLKYIQQFVHTFLKEASKSRPRSRKSSKTSIDLTKENSLMKPEILAIDFNNEGHEAERSKEILELKKTYNLLMKKFVNPNLDLMTSTKTVHDMNILSLKGKQELIRSIMNKIFNERIGQHKQLEGSSGDFSEGNVKSTVDEELSFGWSGQRTSKQAAKPMVETSSHSNNIVTALPETPEEPISRNNKQSNKELKNQFKLNSPKKQLSNSKHFKNLLKSDKALGLQAKNSATLETALQYNNSKDHSIGIKLSTGKTTKDMVLPYLKGSKIPRKIKKEHISDNGLTSSNPNVDSFEETITDTKKKLCPENMVGSGLPSKETFNEPLEPSMNMDLNSHSEINKSFTSLCHRKNNLMDHNQKNNIGIIRSITKVDQNRKAKSDNHPINEKDSETVKVIKTAITDQNKATKIMSNKLQKSVKNLKTSVEKQKTTVGVLKREEPPNNKLFVEKEEQSSIHTTTLKRLPLDPLPNEFRLTSSIEKAPNLTDTTVNTLSENVEVSKSSRLIRKKANKENDLGAGVNLSKPNIETLEKEQNQTFCVKADPQEPSSSVVTEQTNANIGKSTKEAVNEKTKSSDNNYFDSLCNKLYQTSNDAQQLISSLQKSTWETKSVSTSDALNGNLIQSDTCDKQVSLELSNQSSKQDIQNITNRSDLRANSNFQQNTKGVSDLNTPKPQNTESKDRVSVNVEKYSTNNEEKQPLPLKSLKFSEKVNSLTPQQKTTNNQTSKSKCIDSRYAFGANNSAKNFDSNLKDNNVITKSCNDPYNNITNVHRPYESKSNPCTTPRNTNNNKTACREKEFSNVHSKANTPKIRSSASTPIRNHDDSKTELSPKEIYNTDDGKNFTLKKGSKIKKLLRRFNRIQKKKSKSKKPQNQPLSVVGSVQRMYSKFLNDSNHNKMSSHTFKVNKDKNLINKVRSVMRIKSDSLAIGRTSSPTDTIKGKTHSNSSPVSVSKSNTLNSNKSTTIINRQKIPVSSAKVLRESVQGVKVNKVDSNIFSTVNKNIDKYGCVIGIDQTNPSNLIEHTSKEIGQRIIDNSSSKIKTQFDLTKPRKLYSKKEICKSSNLKMYGAKRSIYTHSNPKRNLLKNIFKDCKHENIGEPHFSNLATGSLIKVSTVTAYNKININPVATQVRNLHTTGFRGKVKQLPRKKQTTIIKQNKKNMANVGSTTLYSPNDEGTVSITEMKLNNEPDVTVDRSLKKEPTYEVIKDNSMKDLDPNCENQSNITDNNNCSMKHTSNPLLLPSSIENKTDNNIKVLYNNSTATPQSPDDIKIKSTEILLNVDSQNNPLPQGNVIAIDSPKWKSKTDRLNKWKLEVDSNCTEENIKATVRKTDGSFASCSNDAQHKGFIISEKDLAPERSEDHKTDSGLMFLYANSKKNNFQKDDAKCDKSGKKTINTEVENKKLHNDPCKTIPSTPKSVLIEKKFESNNITSAKIESSKEGYHHNKKDTSTDKIKEFESKLRILESKLRYLELKSYEKQNTEPLQKKSTPETKGNDTTINENKTLKFNKEHIPPQNYPMIKNSELAGTDSFSLNTDTISMSMKYDNKCGKKNKNDPMKEDLSQKVKSLELKLKNIETKILNLKSEPIDLANNKELHNTPSFTRSAEENEKSKPIVFTKKCYERTNNYNGGSNIKLSNLSYRHNQNNKGVKNQEINGIKTVVYEKPEVYLKNYLTTTKNNVEENVQSVKNKSTFNNTKHRNSKIVSLPSQMTSGTKEPKLKNNSLTTIDKISEKVLKKKLLPKSVKLSGIKEANKEMTCGKNKNDMQKNKKDLNFIPNKISYPKTTLTQPSNSVDNVSDKSISGGNLRSASAVNSTSDINVTIQKGSYLSKSPSYIIKPVKPFISSEAALESMISNLKHNNDNEEAKGQNIIRSRKISPKKSPSFNVDKKMLSRINSHQPSSKKNYRHFNCGTLMEEKPNTLHEGLLKSSKLMRSVGPEHGKTLMNVIEKIDSCTQIKLPTCEKISHKSPVFPKRLMQTLRKLTSPPEKQEHNSYTNCKLELARNIDSTELSKSNQEKGNINQNIEKNYNSFDYYRPKRRTHEVKHPIEKEKCGIKLPKNSGNMAANVYQKHLFHNPNPDSEYVLERDKSGKLSAKVYNERDKKLNTLISYKHTNSVRSAQK